MLTIANVLRSSRGLPPLTSRSDTVPEDERRLRERERRGELTLPLSASLEVVDGHGQSLDDEVLQGETLKRGGRLRALVQGLGKLVVDSGHIGNRKEPPSADRG